MYRPILFSTPMVQAILEGRKTMTRRVIKPQSTKQWVKHLSSKDLTDADNEIKNLLERNPIKKGVILWVRETFEDRITGLYPDYVQYLYKADNIKPINFWKPSLFMPKEAARIFLKVTDVNIDRLQNISKEDCLKEGIIEQKEVSGVYYSFNKKKYLDPIDSFKSLWQSINGIESWDENPFLWVYSFERIDKPQYWY